MVRLFGIFCQLAALLRLVFKARKLKNF